MVFPFLKVNIKQMFPEKIESQDLLKENKRILYKFLNGTK